MFLANDVAKPPKPSISATHAGELPKSSPTTNTTLTGLYAGSEHASEWVSFLESNPDVHVPGVPRDDAGRVTNRLALRGMLRIAKIGYDDRSGGPTIAFVKEVAKYITEASHRLKPTQLLHGVIIADEDDMSPEKIREHLEFVESDTYQPIVDLVEDGEDLNGIAEWMSIVGQVPTTGGGDEDDLMGLNPELAM